MWEIISGILGILGFILSVGQIIYLIIKRRRKMIFCLSNDLRFDKNQLHMYYRVDNLSSLPIALTRIRLIIGKEKFDAHFISIRAFSCSEELLIEDTRAPIFNKAVGTDILPVNLDPNYSHGGVLAFQLPKEIQLNLEAPLNLEISTSRGKTVKISLKRHENVLIR